MDKSFDLRVVEFKEQLINMVNESQLPLTCVQFVLGELMQIIGNTIGNSVAEEKQRLSAEKYNSKSDTEKG